MHKTIVHPIVFKQNPLIHYLKNDKRWTISTDDKIPVDANHFLTHNFDIKPASTLEGDPFVTLDDLDAVKELDAVNRAYHLHARDNHIMMIDVEPSAPQEFIDFACDFPAHYTEWSKNGGVHLLIAVPDALITDENRYLFTDLTVLKEDVKDKDREAGYEVIFNNHFITFTKYMFTEKRVADFIHNEQDKQKLARFLNQLVVMDKERKALREQLRKDREKLSAIDTSSERYQRIETFVNLEGFKKYKTELETLSAADYQHDVSRYEASIASKIGFKVLQLKKYALDSVSFRNIVLQLTEDDLMYATYVILKDIIPYRDKHNEDRENMPWLLYTARNGYIFAKTKMNEKKGK